MKHFKNYALAFCGILLSFSCSNGNNNKEEQQEKSTTEKKTVNARPISFTLDGVDIATSDYSCSWSKGGGADVFNLTFFIDKNKYTTLSPTIGINIYHFQADPAVPLYNQKKYKITAPDKQVFTMGYSDFKNKTGNLDETSYTDYDPSSESQLVITRIDKEKKLVSGTFSGTLLNANGKTVVIKNGVFTNLYYQVVQY